MSNKNVVDELHDEIKELAEKSGLALCYRTTGLSNFAVISRIYVYDKCKPRPATYRSAGVIKSWEWGQRQYVGSTKRSERYRVYSDIKKWLEEQKS